MRIAFVIVAFFIAVLSARAESSITSITLERTMCFGSCPVYRLAVRSSGRVEFDGKAFVREKGKRTAQISAQDFARLAKKIEEINFFGLDKRYDGKGPDGTGVTVTDLPTRKTTVTKGRETKTVENYFQGPPGLKELEDLID
ncbi:MAG TPA: DUF6438 domain-containing protein, partial [Chthoniobacterales bacterium]|nr:DUF6438 domain-containing protein [Chthoniobacterales bacterium]